ncbi:unnamed protein product [Blepharisma stoltei]|uniref:Insulin-degrading enzyme n=1 Tax=Blepharisma stoltei TaxID=1481888 RepID=A0AAU9IFI7_9CILI|nr:unnamed protein product [Blepharisma stoltei]
MAVLEKSPIDDRLYKYFELPNKMKCLAISDPTTDISAAAVNVEVGNISDPPEYQGLAHFLEHMLFMGTEKYPGENHYKSFISKHAGYNNASTSQESTRYYFSVSSQNLYEALDIFSQFFIQPLLGEDAVSREMKAVDAEHKKNLKNDIRRYFRLLRMASKPGHPFGLFGTGCFETLNKPDIYTEVKRFYQEKYSSNLMSVAVLGKEPIEILEKWIEDCFSNIPNKELIPDKLEEQPFDETTNGFLTKIISVKNKKEIKFVWQFPGLSQYYLSKPGKYLTHLIGHEGKNSLLSALTNEELASSLVTEISFDLSSFSLFVITITLTDKGFAHYDRVVELVHEHIEILKEKGIQKWVFDELRFMDIANFNNKSEKSPADEVIELSRNLHKYPPEKIISGPCIREEWNPELIRSLLDLMRPSNLQIYFLCQKFDKTNMAEESFYGTFYSRERFSDELLAKMISPRRNSNKEVILDLPVPNDFIPTLFHIEEPQDLKLVPNLLLDDEKNTVWHMFDNSFKADKIIAELMIYCGDCAVHLNPFFHVLAQLWNDMFYHKFRETDYLAKCAGLKLSFDFTYYGLKINLNGYSQRFANFFETVISALSSFEITENDCSIFDIYYIKKKSALESLALSPEPIDEAFNMFKDLVSVNGYFSHQEKLEVLRNVTFQDILWFSKKWLKNVRFEWLILGCINAESALNMAQAVASIFESKRNIQYISKEDYPINEIVTIPSVSTDKSLSNLVYSKHIEDKTNKNSAVVAIWQIGTEDPKAFAGMHIILKFLKEPCFTTLRTKEQLGYIVSANHRRIRGNLYLSIDIQSSVSCCAHVTERISCFIDAMRQKVLEITDEEYEKIKNSAKNAWARKDVALIGKFDRFMTEVVRRSYQFTKKEDIEQVMHSYTKEEFQNLFERIFYKNSARVDLELISENLREEQEVLEKQCEKMKIQSPNYFKRSNAIIYNSR